MGKDEEMDGEVLEINPKGEGDGRVVLREPRKRSSAPRDGTRRLRTLSCFPRVDELVRAGVFARTIAEYIQDEAGEYLDVSFEAVIRSVRRYREELENAGVRAAQDVGGDKDDESDPLFELHELRRSAKMLKERIDMEVGTERQLTKLFSTTHKEIAEYRAHMTDILEEKRKLGIIGKDMNKNRQSVVSSMAGRVDYAKGVGNPESRQKVLAVVEMLMEDPQLVDAIANDKNVVGIPGSNKDLPSKKVRRARRHKGRKAKV